MKRISWYAVAAAALLAVLLFVVLAGSPVLAQQGASPGTSGAAVGSGGSAGSGAGTTGTGGGTAGTRADGTAGLGNNGFNWGWLGLIGLFGLAGLIPRGDRNGRSMAASTTGTGTGSMTGR